MKRAAVLYHYPCPDGAFAALAAHLFFSFSPPPAPHPLFFPNTVYSPLRAEDLPFHETEIADVYLLDFVGPPGFVHQLSPKVDRVVILDHHKTALEMLGSDTNSTSANVTKVIDMSRSGATIAYDYFMEKLLGWDANKRKDAAIREFEKVRKLFEYIEDGDLWKWQLSHSESFSSGLKDLDLEFDVTLNPSLFQQLLSLNLDSIIHQGMLSLGHKKRAIAEVLEQSYEIALGGGAFGHCLAVNADLVHEFRSAIGNDLAKKSFKMNFKGIGAIVYRVPELKNDQILKVSLRSIGDEDTTLISQKYGGGGHKNASSFLINSTEFHRWKVNNSI